MARGDNDTDRTDDMDVMTATMGDEDAAMEAEGASRQSSGRSGRARGTAERGGAADDGIAQVVRPITQVVRRIAEVGREPLAQDERWIAQVLEQPLPQDQPWRVAQKAVTRITADAYDSYGCTRIRIHTDRAPIVRVRPYSFASIRVSASCACPRSKLRATADGLPRMIAVIRSARLQPRDPRKSAIRANPRSASIRCT